MRPRQFLDAVADASSLSATAPVAFSNASASAAVPAASALPIYPFAPSTHPWADPGLSARSSGSSGSTTAPGATMVMRMPRDFVACDDRPHDGSSNNAASSSRVSLDSTTDPGNVGDFSSSVASTSSSVDPSRSTSQQGRNGGSNSSGDENVSSGDSSANTVRNPTTNNSDNSTSSRRAYADAVREGERRSKGSMRDQGRDYVGGGTDMLGFAPRNMDAMLVPPATHAQASTDTLEAVARANAAHCGQETLQHSQARHQQQQQRQLQQQQDQQRRQQQQHQQHQQQAAQQHRQQARQPPLQRQQADAGRPSTSASNASGQSPFMADVTAWRDTASQATYEESDNHSRPASTTPSVSGSVASWPEEPVATAAPEPTSRQIYDGSQRPPGSRAGSEHSTASSFASLAQMLETGVGIGSSGSPTVGHAQNPQGRAASSHQPASQFERPPLPHRTHTDNVHRGPEPMRSPSAPGFSSNAQGQSWPSAWPQQQPQQPHPMYFSQPRMSLPGPSAMPSYSQASSGYGYAAPQPVLPNHHPHSNGLMPAPSASLSPPIAPADGGVYGLPYSGGLLAQTPGGTVGFYNGAAPPPPGYFGTASPMPLAPWAAYGGRSTMDGRESADREARRSQSPPRAAGASKSEPPAPSVLLPPQQPHQPIGWQAMMPPYPHHSAYGAPTYHPYVASPSPYAGPHVTTSSSAGIAQAFGATAPMLQQPHLPPFVSSGFSTDAEAGERIRVPDMFGGAASGNESGSGTNGASTTPSGNSSSGSGDLLKGSSAKPFQCDVCQQSFHRNHDLKRHKRIHLTVKPLPCPFCEKRFTRKDALKRHLLVRQHPPDSDVWPPHIAELARASPETLSAYAGTIATKVIPALMQPSKPGAPDAQPGPQQHVPTLGHHHAQHHAHHHGAHHPAYGTSSSLPPPGPPRHH